MLHSANLTNEKLFQAQRLETVSFVGGKLLLLVMTFEIMSSPIMILRPIGGLITNWGLGKYRKKTI